MKILFTGFEPFGGESVNPSWEAVKLLPEEISGVKLVRERLPVSFSRCGEMLRAALEKYCPRAVVCVGQAGGRAGITVERVAVNLMEAGLPDADGFAPHNAPIDPDGPAAFFSTLNAEKLTQAIRERGVPASVSYSAGTYVCNCTLYHLLRMGERRKTSGIFIHLPYLPEQAVLHPVGTPSMSMESATLALHAAAEAVADELHPV